MAEQTFFQQGNVTVTNSRFIVGGQTYTMSGVTSVQGGTVAAKRGLWIGLIVLGLLAMLGHAFAAGLIMMLIGGAVLFVLKDDHVVILHNSGNQSRALTSKDPAYIQQVVAALNNAIVHRG